MSTTQGDLKPATIKNTISGDEVKFMFNPHEYTLTKQNSWNKKDSPSKNVPKLEFKGGGAVTLKLTLHFDTYASGDDVRGITGTLWKMMMIDTSTEDSETEHGHPPPVEFAWGGRTYLKAVITSMSEKYTLFNKDGVPMRSEVQISLQEYVDEGDTPSQVPGQRPGQGVTPSTQMVEGQRVDNVAAAAGTNHRDLAEQNNIDNPQNIPAGTTLRT